MFIKKIIFILFLCINFNVFAQNSFSDCNGALPICGNQNVNLLSIGTGQVADNLTDDFGCTKVGGENGTVWYKFRIGKSGTLTFTITPSSPSDYDWALWGTFPENFEPCNGKLGSPIRCSADGFDGATGLSLGSTITSGAPDIYVNSRIGDEHFVKYLDVVEGEIYYLMIDNCSLNPSCNPNGSAEFFFFF